jgi:hypothetical protein
VSNPTYSSQAFKQAVAPRTTLLGELFAATPLYIFVTGLKKALQQPGRS